jgi:hypothetical protein
LSLSHSWSYSFCRQAANIAPPGGGDTPGLAFKLKKPLVRFAWTTARNRSFIAASGSIFAPIPCYGELIPCYGA